MKNSYIVGCRGVVKLGGLVPKLSLGGLTKVKVCKSFLFTEVSLKVENKQAMKLQEIVVFNSLYHNNA